MDAEILDVNFGEETTEPIFNGEVASLIDYLDDALRQLTAAPSASERNWMEPDLAIAADIHSRLETMVTQFAADPQLYMPNSDKVTANVPAAPSIKQPENQGVLIIVRHLARFRTQLRNGVSGQQTSGFHPKEKQYVIDPALTKLKSYINNEQTRFTAGDPDYFPDVNDQDPTRS